MSSQDRLQQHRALNPKQSGIGRTSNSGIADTNLVNLDPDDTIISSASQVRPEKTTSASPARQTSESDRETPDDSQPLSFQKKFTCTTCESDPFTQL